MNKTIFISFLIGAVIISMAGLSSCSVARFQPLQRDSIFVSRVDSVTVLDSVYIDRTRTIKEKADTVYIIDTKIEYKYRYRDRVKTDTLYVEKVITETVEVEKKLNWWQKFRLNAFWYMAGAVALWVVWKVIKLKFKI